MTNNVTINSDTESPDSTALKPDTPLYFEDACYEIATGIARLVISKQMDYGHENIMAFGEMGVLVRANDKMARLKNLQNKDAVNEPTEDSWKDLAGYSLIALMLRKGWFTLPLKD